jgi:hypothetical protein
MTKLMSVDFPEPDGPTSAIIFPGAAENEMSDKEGL